MVTTSWDDGHPCDLRIAEMLASHSIPGTFYIPAQSQFERMNMRDVRNLGQTFEVGAHTMRHLRLPTLSPTEAYCEIAGSKDYIEQLLGSACTMFAPPGGKFKGTHLRVALQAGFKGFRTTELMSVARPRRHLGMVLMPTTLQVFDHPPLAYWKNAVRRANLFNLSTYLRHARRRDLFTAFESLLQLAVSRGGVLHLWGHGWEIQQHNLWNILNRILKHLAERNSEVRLVSNTALCDWILSDESSTVPVSNPVLP
jgi:peptidoglycan/xylan/chitin deacetylase (PgdA/CDA1 family)